jgi:hypothetical protein
MTKDLSNKPEPHRQGSLKVRFVSVLRCGNVYAFLCVPLVQDDSASSYLDLEDAIEM